MIIYTWAIAKWGNAHVDSLFCDRIGELLSDVYPELKPWGKPSTSATGELMYRTRSWSQIIKNIFSNVRQCKVSAAGCGLLWVVGCGLWAVGCGLWAVGCGLWAVGCGL